MRLKNGTAQGVRLANSARIFFNLSWYDYNIEPKGHVSCLLGSKSRVLPVFMLQWPIFFSSIILIEYGPTKYAEVKTARTI